MKNYTVRCVFSELHDVNVEVQARSEEEAIELAEKQSADTEREISHASFSTISTRIISADEVEPEPEEDENR